MGKKNKAKKAAQVQLERVTEEQNEVTEEPETTVDADCIEEEKGGHGPWVTFNDYCKRMATCGLAVPDIGNRSTAAEAKRWAKVFVEALALTLAHGETVHIPGLGRFSCVERKERAGTNPRTAEKIVIAAHKAVVFSPAKAIKEAVKG